MKLALMTAMTILVFANFVAAARLPKPLLDSYLQVQLALAGDTMDGVATHAASIAAAAGPLGSDAEKLISAAKKLQGAKDIAAARSAFGDVSDALIAYAEKTNSELGPDVRIAFCPMVNKPWLQTDKEIRNPYYGKSMLSCGSFRTSP